MIFTYYSPKSHIDKVQAERFIASQKGRNVEDVSLIAAAMLNPLSQLVAIIGSGDTDVIDILLSSKLKRSVKIITREVSVAVKLKDKIISVFIIDDTTEYMPDYWDSPVLHYQNMCLLQIAGKRPVYYEFTNKSDSVMFTAFVEETDTEHGKANYIVIRNLSEKESINEFKQELTSRTKRMKSMFDGRKAKDNETFAGIKKGIVPPIYVCKDIVEYIIRNNYATQDQVDRAEGIRHQQGQSKMAIEQALCLQGAYSREDLVAILRGHLNEQILSRSELDNLNVKFKVISDKLKSQGVVEAYDKGDTEYKNVLLVIPYTKKDELMDIVNKTVNFSRVLLTLPEYLEDMTSESVN